MLRGSERRQVLHALLHVCDVGDQVNTEAIETLHGFVVIRRELTKADHTLVLPPFNMFNEAVRSP